MEKSSHWYDADCVARHTIVGKNGKERGTTIRDARENNWYPSVTTILGILAKPQLENWKMETVAAKAFETPTDGLSKETYISKVMETAFEKVDEAADLGTAIHKAIESHFLCQPFDPAMSVYVEAVDKWVAENNIVFDAHELRLVNKTIGYAGTTDASFTSPKGFGIGDFKSRKSTPGKPMTAYETEVVQIAAYHVAKHGPILDLPGTKEAGWNLLISTTEPGRVEAVWYSKEDLAKAWEAFWHACKVWQYLKNYNPGK